MIRFPLAFALVVAISMVPPALAQDDAAAKKASEDNSAEASDVRAGHSYHGEFLNEGPRQKAYLMGGTGRVRFPVTTKVELAQKFIEQGVGQLHGFWYLEAERSFRQAAALDSDCAMAYWGAALATKGNEKRAKGFIAEAVKRKDKASDRERKYIDALDAYFKADKKKRKENYLKALEEISIQHPDDLEAKAFLALRLYGSRKSGTYVSTDALIRQIFAVEPQHPAHHFRIHLWDHKKPERVLDSAAVCGQSAPQIAHMWHMPGHIYSRLKRYDDACWQQEASARVDHAHMMRDRVMPDEIHNFAHNNEWLIRNLNYVGRVRDAVELAKNMIELPRHPRYNSLQKSGSARYGRSRLVQTLSRYELWNDMIALCNSSYLEPTDDFQQQIRRLRYLGTAYIRSGDFENGEAQLKDLRDRRSVQDEARTKAVTQAKAKKTKEVVDQKQLDKAIADAAASVKADGADEDQIEEARIVAAQEFRDAQIEKNKKKIEQAGKDAAKPLDSKVADLDKAIAALEGHQAVVRGDFKAALPLLRKAGSVDPIYLAMIRHQAAETDAAIADARKHVAKHKNEVQPLAGLVELLWRADKKEDAKKSLEQLRKISGSIDLASPVFERISPIAAELGFSTNWRVERSLRDDIGDRPELDSLGPFRWQPSPAASWELADTKGQMHSLAEFSGKPVILIFYLGSGCLHCAEQLQAFAPMTDKYKESGIAMIAISTDDKEGLQRSIDDYDKGDLTIPLVSNAELNVFKDYRVVDDFEDQPLHGTFLIDAKGLVRWQDIGHEPFMDAAFLLKEARRLLRQ